MRVLEMMHLLQWKKIKCFFHIVKINNKTLSIKKEKKIWNNTHKIAIAQKMVL